MIGSLYLDQTFLLVQICCIADKFDGLTNHKAYRCSPMPVRDESSPMDIPWEMELSCDLFSFTGVREQFSSITIVVEHL